MNENECSERLRSVVSCSLRFSLSTCFRIVALRNLTQFSNSMDENANFGRHYPHGQGEGEGDLDGSDSYETIQPPSTSSSSSSSRNSNASSVLDIDSESSSSSSCQYLRSPKPRYDVNANLRSTVQNRNEPTVMRSRRKTIADKFRLQAQHHYDFLIWGKQPPDVKVRISNKL